MREEWCAVGERRSLCLSLLWRAEGGGAQERRSERSGRAVPRAEEARAGESSCWGRMPMMERARGELLGEGERWCVQGVDAERVHLLGRMSSCEGGRRKLASQQELLKAHVCPMPSGGGHGEHGVNICSLREVEASTGEAGPSFRCVQSPPAHRSSQAATSPGRQCGSALQLKRHAAALLCLRVPATARTWHVRRRRQGTNGQRGASDARFLDQKHLPSWIPPLVATLTRGFRRWHNTWNEPISTVLPPGGSLVASLKIWTLPWRDEQPACGIPPSPIVTNTPCHAPETD